ncbi:type IV toxin-antitoxin system AbiEi family antitoxin domain-containing protein [Rhodococcoides kyotonense]|nr:type IV toxin-antitoxin system AbiEi family antitoxin domain-containing protein [Rhodococcus kyotonensis]
MGVYTRTQLVESGISPAGIARRVRSGALVRLLPSVYSDPEPTYLDLCVAVTLWRGDAVLSHDSAAWLWNLLDGEPSTVHATVPRSVRCDSVDWLVLHRRSVPTFERQGLPVVSAVQCFVDVAASLEGASLEQFFDHNMSTRVSWRAVADHLDTAKGMKGMVELRRQLEVCCPGTLSEPERMVARALRARGIRMEINAPIGPYFGDLVDELARVDVEIDGREVHSTPRTFDNDRVRQNWMVIRRWLVLRYSAATVYRDVDKVADEIAAIVRRRRKSRGN